MHPVEFVALQATAFVPIFVIPVWAGSFVFLLIYVLLYNIKDHSGIVLTSLLPWQGTHRRVNRRYGEDAFGGKGAATDDDSGEDEPQWVKY